MELELKLAASTSALARLRASPLLTARSVYTHKSVLCAAYFDTADHALEKRGLALRLRWADGRWAQALKGKGSAQGGLHARDEWEFDTEPNVLDLAMFRDTPLAELEREAPLAPRLAKVFETRFTRDVFIVPEGEAEIEVALDEGEIVAGNKRVPICEVELELKSGEPIALFRLARALAAEVPLRPASLSKAQRGWALVHGHRLEPVKASRVTLDALQGVEAAAQAVVAACLAQFEANLDGVLTSNDAEFVHQARVALRRLRSALRLFRKPLGDALPASVAETLRALARALGEARDADVFAIETLPELVEACDEPVDLTTLSRTLETQRREARRRARAALRRAEVSDALLAFAQWLITRPATSGEGLPAWALEQMARMHRRFAKAVDDFAALSDEARHAARIRAKRARYVAEFLADALPRDAARDYARALAQAQETLGRANDAREAVTRLEALDVPRDFMSFARGFLGTRAKLAAHDAQAAVDAALAAGRAWSR